VFNRRRRQFLDEHPEEEEKFEGEVEEEEKVDRGREFDWFEAMDQAQIDQEAEEIGNLLQQYGPNDWFDDRVAGGIDAQFEEHGGQPNLRYTESYLRDLSRKVTQLMNPQTIADWFNMGNNQVMNIVSAMRFYCYYEFFEIPGTMHENSVWRRFVYDTYINPNTPDLADYDAWMRQARGVLQPGDFIPLSDSDLGTLAYIINFMQFDVTLAERPEWDAAVRLETDGHLFWPRVRAYINLNAVLRENMGDEMFVYFLLQYPFGKTAVEINVGDAERPLLVHTQVVPNLMMKLEWNLGDVLGTSGYVVAERLLERMLRSIMVANEDISTNWLFTFKRRVYTDVDGLLHDEAFFTVPIHDIVVNANLNFNLEAQQILIDVYNQLTIMMGNNAERYQEDEEAGGDATTSPSIVSILVTIRTHVRFQQQLLQTLRNRPRVFCRKSLGGLREYAKFSQCTDRLCLYEVYHQMTQDYGGLVTRPMDERRKAIYEDFLLADQELQKICVSGDFTAFIAYCRMKDMKFNFVVWENSSPNPDWDIRVRDTVVLKDAHAILCDTKSISKKVMTMWKNAVSKRNKANVPFYELKIKAPVTTTIKAIHYSWDIECCRQVDSTALVPYLICVTNVQDEKDRFVFPGLGCELEFVKWVKSLADFDTKNKKGHSKGKPAIYFWGFNTHRFDLMFMLPLMFRLCPDVALTGSLTKVRQLKIGQNIEFLDLWCACPYGSLSSMVKSWLGTEYQKGELDHKSIDTLNYTDYLNEALPYCINDCVITGKLIQRWLEYNETKQMNPFVMSVSQWSMDWFRTFYLKKNLKGLHKRDYNRIKATYSGGICLHVMKRIKKGNAYDSNSCYPWSMTFDVPTEHLGYSASDLVLKHEDHEQIVDCWIYYINDYEWVDGFLFPYFIERDDDGGVMFYKKKPNPVAVGIWGESLRFALRMKLLKEPIKVLGIDKFNAEPIFKEFVENEYKQRLQMKKEKNVFMDQMHKGRLNNTYGKLAQMLHNKNVWCGDEQALYLLKTYQASTYIHSVKNPTPGVWNIEFDDLDYGNSIGGFVHIASKITDRCRLAWVKVAMASIALGMNVAYGDTDSVHVEGELPVSHPYYDCLELPNPLLDETKLGCFKVEYAFEEAIYCAKKVYILKKADGSHIMRMKGVPKKVLEKDPDIWNKYVQMSETGRMEVDIPEFFYRHAGFVEVKDLHKTLTVRNKRLFLDCGLSLPL
jgi:hypothetical protein